MKIRVHNKVYFKIKHEFHELARIKVVVDRLKLSKIREICGRRIVLYNLICKLFLILNRLCVHLSTKELVKISAIRGERI